MLSKPNRTQPGRKKISLLMARAYRGIERENPEKLRLWNDAFGVLSRVHYILLLFWRQNAFIRSQRMLPTYLLGVLVAISRYLLTLFLFGKRVGMRRGEQASAPVDKYIPTLEPLVQHTPQLLFLLALLFGIFPRLFPDSSDFCNVSFINRVGSTKKVELQSSYLIPSSFSNSPSVSTVTPSSFALSYFDPGSAPTTT
jgi:hypothetical protein